MKKWIAVTGILTIMFSGLYAYASINRSNVPKDGYYEQLEEGRLFGAYMLDNNHAWAVGNKGKVFSYRGNGWTQHKIMTEKDLFSIYASSPTDVWAVGVSGVMLHYDGEWGVTTSGGGAGKLKSVSGLDESHIWSVGEEGVILYYDGLEWYPQDSGVKWNLNCVYALDSEHVWVAGSGGILFFNGRIWSTAWETRSSGLFPGLNGIYAEDENNAWAVGSAQGGFSSSVLFFDGRLWKVVYDKFGTGVYKPPEDTFEPLQSVYADQGTVYAVGVARGKGGIILTGNGKDWKVTKVKESFLLNISGFDGNIFGAGYHTGHDNLKNDTAYIATVFNVTKLIGFSPK